MSSLTDHLIIHSVVSLISILPTNALQAAAIVTVLILTVIGHYVCPHRQMATIRVVNAQTAELAEELDGVINNLPHQYGILLLFDVDGLKHRLRCLILEEYNLAHRLHFSAGILQTFHFVQDQWALFREIKSCKNKCLELKGDFLDALCTAKKIALRGQSESPQGDLPRPVPDVVIDGDTAITIPEADISELRIHASV